MKKKVKIFGKEIKRAVRRGIMENIMEHWEMKDTYSKAKYKQSPREGGIESIFGQYGEEIPSSVLRYLRKNPAAIIKRLHKLYGDDIYKWLPSQSPVMDNWEFEEEEEVVSEVEDMKVYDKNEVSKALDDDSLKGAFGYKQPDGEIKTVTVNEIKKMLGRKSKKKNKFRR